MFLEKAVTYPHLEIVERCIKNDRQAQQELYSLYAQPMYNVCYRIVNHQEEAEDVLQEAFIRMFKNIDTYRKDSSFGVWFKRIVVNGALNHIKKKDRVNRNLEKIKND